MGPIRRWVGLGMLLVSALGVAQKGSKAAPKIVVPSEPGSKAAEIVFVDKKTGVGFHVPPGWELARKDGEVSTFHLDARTAPPNAQMRGVAIIDFNPFPHSTLSGASFYFSVQPKSDEVACARQATASGQSETQPIGGMPFTHGHDEHGDVCIEARDEVYTAYRKHACYRFDLAIQTFCSVSSGAQEISERQLLSIQERMTAILSTVTLPWVPAGANPVPVPKDSSERVPLKKM